ncbi:hypothetical protein FCV53_23320 [Vibrio sp. F12]|uniref:hypothetical protein n=1 Tax=Vibrio sp. F12 TaxID=2070776 RepID=UPI0010BD9C4E|nr:hypothetical protein [Vibrio sp. F12]TKE88180.1 hypothetical protein FCV53_23320 [Vibrio sp. F12]
MLLSSSHRDVDIKEIEGICSNSDSNLKKIQKMSQILEVVNKELAEYETLSLKDYKAIDDKYYVRHYIVSKINDLNSLIFIQNLKISVMNTISYRYKSDEKSRNLAVKSSIARTMIYIEDLIERRNDGLLGESLNSAITSLKYDENSLYFRLESALIYTFLKAEKSQVLFAISSTGFKEEIKLIPESGAKISEKKVNGIVQRALSGNIHDSLDEFNITKVLNDATREIEIYHAFSQGDDKAAFRLALAKMAAISDEINTSLDYFDETFDQILLKNNIPKKVLIRDKSRNGLEFQVMDTMALFYSDAITLEDIIVYEKPTVIERFNDVINLISVLSEVMDLEGDDSQSTLAIEKIVGRENFDSDSQYYAQFVDYKNSDIEQDLNTLIRDQSIYQSDLNSNVSIISSADIILPFYSKNAIKNILDDYVVGKAEGIAEAYRLVEEKFPNCDDSVKVFIALFANLFMSAPTTEAITLAIKPAVLMLQTHLGMSGRVVLVKDSNHRHFLVCTFAFHHRVTYLGGADNELVTQLIEVLPKPDENWKDVSYEALNAIFLKLNIPTGFDDTQEQPKPFLLRNHRFDNFMWDAVQETTLLKFNLIAQSFKKVGTKKQFQENYLLKDLVANEFKLSLSDKLVEMKEVLFTESSMEAVLNNKVPFLQVAQKMINDPDYEVDIQDVESILLDSIVLLADIIPIFSPIAKALDVNLSVIVNACVVKNIRVIRLSKTAFMRSVVNDISDEFIRRSKFISSDAIGDLKNKIRAIKKYKFMKETSERLETIKTMGLSGGAGSFKVNSAYGASSGNVVLETFDWCFNGKGPVGKVVSDNKIPLPAQPEVFQSIIDEKVSIVRQADEPILISGWRSPQTGRIHILDGQHRFIAAAKLGIPVEVKIKKFGTVPTQVDWSGTKFSQSTPAKHKIKGVQKPIFKKTVVQKATNTKGKVENIHIHPELRIGSIGRPNKNYSTGAQLMTFCENLKRNNVAALISLDSGMSAREIVSLTKQLASHNIEYISNKTTYIKDFFSIKALTQPSSEDIDGLANRVLKLLSTREGNVLVHCALGDGRSGMVKSAVIMKQMFNEGRLDLSNLPQGTKAYVKPSIESEQAVLSYLDVKNSIDTIRKTHPKALERSDDIEVLNQYLEYLQNQSATA